MEFIWIAFRSPTFWKGPAAYGLLVLMLCVAAVWVLMIIAGRRPRRQLLNDQSGAAAAIDFTMTLPILLLVVLLAVQYALLANAALIVHYAAYNAARSARVHFFDTSSMDMRLLRASGLGHPFLYRFRNGDTADKKARDAAYLTLISISPAKDTGSAVADKTPAWDSMDRFLSLLAEGTNASGISTLKTKARYAFDTRNTRVTVGLDTGIGTAASALLNSQLLKGREEWPVEASVTYRYHLGLPVGRLLGKLGHDGLYGTDLTAKVTLL